ncbi:MAG: hypothetical protein ACOCQ4_01245 [bacterium]
MENNVSNKAILFFASILAIVFFLVTFYFYYFVFKLVFLSKFSFLMNYVLFYLFALLLIIIAGFIFVKNKTAGMKSYEGSFSVLGVYSYHYINRTGVKYIDFIGLLASVVFTLTSVMFSSLHFLVPFFILTSIAFFFAMTTGSAKPWILRKK